MKKHPCLYALILAIAVTALVGCSFSYLYRQLDWLVPWYISDYITLDERQHTELEKRLLAQLDWHCSTQLQRYADWLRQLHDTPDAFSRDRLEQHYETTRHFWRDLMARVVVDTATILSRASDKQIDELIANLERKQRESEKEMSGLSSEARAKQRVGRMTRLLERWLGKLDPFQKRQVTIWSGALEKQGDASWQVSRRNWQQHFKTALLQHRHEAGFTRLLYRLFVTPEELWSDRYRRAYRQQKDRTLDMFAAVAAAMTPSQHAHLQHELLSLADEFQSLSCAPPGKVAR